VEAICVLSTRRFEVGPLIDLAQEVIGKGYTAVKVVFVPYSEPLEGIGKVKRFAALMSKLREAVGDAVEVMIDFHGRTYPAGCVASL
jgi:galactonate dehydratase